MTDRKRTASPLPFKTLHGSEEIEVWIIPVIVGKGQRLYDAIDPASLKLRLEAQKVFGNGSVLLTYVPER
ncbi:hypothetical protein EJ066_01775 [Mesorhizobium sp. M9A.F.Ca.ET.002.03.1.2]|uniref:hypothetical protein n=1 Tax=Mesorhizobium sp. M9A.F.Ca.ET.002.03.1.2 TaxID=2493668 RepID=UPI000F7544F8|nr:hypothetical protein [Mesorhizobium sp. M9A.F.Ca.ET.002.03.1.2]AZN96121.1 hypothetical protein EJ066_01775 [Mesorhizobium sp. M9A.F.Ca.ET.002.03.1.2]